MSQIDDRIVALEFDNKQFESGAKQSLQTIEELKKSMKFDDMSKNLTDFSKNATKNFDLTKMQSSLDTLKDRFSATGIAGMEVIKRLTNAAMDAGKAITSKLTSAFNIMVEGGKSRAANIDQAKFMLEGLGVAWADLYDDIDYAVAGTAYGLDAAATAASQLTASGVQAGESMKKALRGISGVAAMTNSQYEEISPIFTTVAGQGKLMTMQLRQLESRGLNAAAELGKALGKTETEIRDMVTKGKIDFKTFADAMDSAFGEHAKESNKTFEGALGNMQFALKKIGAEFFTPYRAAMIPVFNQTRLMINEIKNNLTGVFPIVKDVLWLLSNRLTNAIFKVTEFLKNDFTGAEHLANGLRNVVQIFIRLAAAVSTAFKELFGDSKSVGDSVNSAAEAFENITEALIPSNETLTIIKNVLVAIGKVMQQVVMPPLKVVFGMVGKAIPIAAKLITFISLLVSKLFSLGVELFKNSTLFKNIQAAGGYLSFAFQKVVTVLTNLRNILSDNTTIIGRVASTIKSAASTIIMVLGGGLFITIMKIIEVVNNLRNNFPQVLDTIKTKISDFITRLRQIPILSQAFDNLKMIFESMKNAVTNVMIVLRAMFNIIRGNSAQTRGAMAPATEGMNLLAIAGNKVLLVLHTIKVAAGAAFIALASIFNTVVSMVRGFNIGDIINKIKDLVNRVKDLELVKTAIEAFRSSGGNLVVTLKAVVDKIKEFFDNLRNSGVSVLDFFVDKIKTVITVIKDFFASFGKNDGGDQMTRSIEAKSSVLETLKEKFITVKDVVVKGLAKIRDEGLLTKVLMVAYVLAILKALIQIPNSIHRVSKSLTGEGGIFTSIQNIAGNFSNFIGDLRKGAQEGTSLFGSLREAVTNWGNAQRKSKIELLGGLLRDIAISIAILAGSLAILTLVDTDKLKEVAIVLGVFSAVLIAVAGAVTYASGTKLVKDTWFSSFAANMLAMTISIGILGGLIIAFSKIKIDDLWAALRTLGIVLLLMVAMGAVMQLIAGLDFKGTTLRSAIFMIAFALSIKSLAKTLKELADIKIANTDSFIIAMIGLFGGMAVLIGIASSITPASALAVVAIVFAIQKIIDAFKGILGSISSGDITAMLAEAKDQIMVMVIFVSAMVTILTVAAMEVSVRLALAGAAIGKGLLQVGAAFLLFGIGLMMIQSAIKKMTKLDLLANDLQGLSSLLIILGSIVLTFAGLVGLANKLGGVDTALLKIAGAIALLSIAMFNVAVVAHIVKNLELGPILKAIGILVAIMGSMTLMVLAVKSGNGTLAFKTVLATVLGFTLLIGALIVLALMCSNDKIFEDLGKALALIVGILLSMAFVLMQVSKINTGQSWKPILAMVVMLGAVFGALYLLSQNIHDINDLIALGGIAAVIVGTLWALIALTKSLTAFAKENNLGRSKAVVKSLAALGVMLAGFIAVAAVLAGFAYITKGIDVADIGLKALAVIGTLYLLVLSAEKLTTLVKGVKMGDFGRMAIIMGSMIVALIAVAGAVAVVGMIPMGDDIGKKMLVVGLVLAELVGLSILMGKFGTASKGTYAALGSLAILTVIFGLLAAVCIALNMVPADNGTLAKSQTVILVLAELVAINYVLGQIGAKTNALGAVGALCLIPLIAIFGLLALVCMALNAVPTEGFLAKSQTVMLVLTELIALNALLGVLVEAGGVAALGAVGAICLIPLIAIFGLLALVCGAISLVPCEGMMEKTQTIILVLLELEGLLAILGTISPLAAAAMIAIPGLISVCLAMITIAGIIKLLEGVSAEGMGETLDLLTGALWEIVGIGATATAASVGLVALGAAILMMGVACLAAGAGVQMFAEGIASLASTTPQQLTNLQNVIMTFCTSIAEGIYQIIVQTGQAIIDTINAIIAYVISIIYGGASSLMDSGQKCGTSLFEGFKMKAMEILKIPGDIIQGLISSIGSTLSSLFNAGLDMGKSIVEGFRSGAQWHSPPSWLLAFFSDASSTAESEGSRTAQIFGETGEEWGNKIKNKYNETINKWNFGTIKQKGLDAINSITSGLKAGEGDLINEVNFINNLIGNIGGNLSAKGWQTSLSDFEYQLKSERKKLISERNAIDYEKGNNLAKQRYKELNNQVGEYDEKLKTVTQQIGKATSASLKLNDVNNKTAESFGKAGGGAGKASKEMQDFAGSLEQTLEGQMNIFQKFEKKEAMSKDELLANMRSQIQGMQEWAVQMQSLAAKGIDQGLYQELANMGPQGAEYVGAFAQMTAEELQQANQLWAQSLVLPKQVASQVAGAFNGIGQNIMAGEAAGIASGKSQAINEAVSAQNDITNQSKDAVGVQSPSTVFAEIGKFLMQGLANGIKAHGGEATTQVKKICAEILSSARSQLNYGTFYSIGMNVVLGLAEGLNNEEVNKKLNAAITSLSLKMQEITTKLNQIHSPSRVYYGYGKNIVEGLANGIRDYTKDAVSSIEDLSIISLDTMKETISGIAQMLDDEVDNPIITPVLDLSNVQAGARTLNNMFSATQALNASASIDTLQNEQLNSSKLGTTFIQNNYSPKALSRTEIYRQTKNQFSAYREAFS